MQLCASNFVTAYWGIVYGCDLWVVHIQYSPTPCFFTPTNYATEFATLPPTDTRNSINYLFNFTLCHG